MNNLFDFIKRKMSMSHVYQPVMVKTLLQNKGEASKTQIAQDILRYDFSQVEYYEKVTDNMVGRILRKHSIVEKDKNLFYLKEFKNLSPLEINELIALCDTKIEDYIKKRGKAIWEHRRKNRKTIPGSVRYLVLNRAKGRCELCGISKEEKALEVDHILPKNLGGKDSINNYQALCYTCNANKRDLDDTDFRSLETFYMVREKSCPFCNSNRVILLENNLAKAIFDKYPVSPFHVLIVPKRHCETYFDLTQPELNAINDLTHQIRDMLLRKDKSIEGFNLGYNSGQTAGQTIPHCHLHIIPRRKGDVQNPIGGIRNIFTGRGDYTILKD